MNKQQLISYILLIIITAPNLGCAVAAPVAAIATAGLVMAEERSVGNMIDDKVINAKIKNAIGQNNHTSKLSVTIVEGRVLLVGVAKKAEYIRDIIRIIWTIKGVKELINEVQIGSLENKHAKNDAFISAQIRGKFLLEKSFKSRNYGIDVYKGVVYIIGIAQNNDELGKALAIISSVSGIEKIKNFSIIKEDVRRIQPL